jgi:hypothetical protein
MVDHGTDQIEAGVREWMGDDTRPPLTVTARNDDNGGEA